jgi:very-short-patch-repair endonuclease
MSDDPPDNTKRGWGGRLPSPKMNEQLRPRARALRSEQTPAESRLWARLRRRQRMGFSFRRQHIIDRFIVDFYCPEARLVIEVDGAAHRSTGERDSARQEWLENLGLRVMRVTNEAVMNDLPDVIAAIETALQGHG